LDGWLSEVSIRIPKVEERIFRVRTRREHDPSAALTASKRRRRYSQNAQIGKPGGIPLGRMASGVGGFGGNYKLGVWC